jgi:hypothetical protein
VVLGPQKALQYCHMRRLGGGPRRGGIGPRYLPAHCISRTFTCIYVVSWRLLLSSARPLHPLSAVEVQLARLHFTGST